MVILHFLDLLKELRRIIINVNHRNLTSGTNSSTVRGNIGLYEATEQSSIVYNFL